MARTIRYTATDCNTLETYPLTHSSDYIFSVGDVVKNNYGVCWSGSGNGIVHINNNDIFNNLSWNAYMDFSGSTMEFDFENNWWGTTDGVAISSTIHDHSDNTAMPVINYLPFLDASGGNPTSD